MHSVGMDILLILLSLGPENHHSRGQDITMILQIALLIEREIGFKLFL
jgi:hypothetical protein